MPLVYLADSCQLTRSILMHFLQDANIDVKPLGHAREVVTALTQAGVYSHNENVVLIHDLESIHCGGSHLVRVARKMPVSKNLRIIGITFTRPQKQLDALLQLGIDAIVFKEDLSRQTLIAQVQNLLSQTSSNAESIDQSKSEEPDYPRPLTSAEFDRAVISVAKGKSIKPVVHEVLRITADNRSNVDDLVDAIRNDPTLTAKVVGVSHTAYYRRTGGEVKNLQDAVTLIGVNAVQQLALSLNIADDINDTDLDPILQLPRLWGHSLATAHLAEWIATETGLCDPGQAYVVGILHDFGRRLMTWQLPKHYELVLTEPEPANLSLLGRERRFVGIDHAILASRVLERWGCPPFLVRAIALHHSQSVWDKCSVGKMYDLVRVIQIADALATAFGFEADETDDIPVIPLSWLTEKFANPEEQSQRMCGTLMERIGLLMGRSNYPIELPTIWQGRVSQFILLGNRPMDLEPLQATLLRSYIQSKIVAPNKADLNENASIVVLDWRGMDLTDCVSTLNWLIDHPEISHWPLLIVGHPPELRLELLPIPNNRIIKLGGIITPGAVLKSVDELSTHFYPNAVPEISAA